jgi:hypothetical protein
VFLLRARVGAGVSEMSRVKRWVAVVGISRSPVKVMALEARSRTPETT